MKERADMKKYLPSLVWTLTVFCLEASVSAKAQEFFFASAYARPVELVDGIGVGTRGDDADIFARKAAASAPTAAAGRRQIAHRFAH